MPSYRRLSRQHLLGHQQKHVKQAVNPPAAAAWLLSKFGTGFCDESIAGDLLEEFRSGRSPSWYWKQVLQVFVHACRQVLIHHTARLIVSLTVGWVTLVMTKQLLRPLNKAWRYLIESHPGLVDRTTTIDIYSMISGIPAFPIIVLTHALAATVVRQVARSSGNQFVCAFLITVWAARLPWIVRLAEDSVGESRYLPYLVENSVALLMATIGVLAGSGLIARGPPTMSSLQRDPPNPCR